MGWTVSNTKKTLIKDHIGLPAEDSIISTPKESIRDLLEEIEG